MTPEELRDAIAKIEPEFSRMGLPEKETDPADDLIAYVFKYHHPEHGILNWVWWVFPAGFRYDVSAFASTDELAAEIVRLYRAARDESLAAKP